VHTIALHGTLSFARRKQPENEIAKMGIMPELFLACVPCIFVKWYKALILARPCDQLKEESQNVMCESKNYLR
jgi:hypothetical protein